MSSSLDGVSAALPRPGAGLRGRNHSPAHSGPSLAGELRPLVPCSSPPAPQSAPPFDPLSASDEMLKDAARRWRLQRLNDVVAHPARIQNHLLGGNISWTLDRTWCEDAIGVLPTLRLAYRTEQRFLVRALDAVREAGIRRFLVFGDTAPELNPAAEAVLASEGNRLVYVAHDEWLLAHWGSVSARHPAIGVVPGSFAVPGTFLAAEATQRLLAPGEPVCLVLASALETLFSTDAAAAALRACAERLPLASMVIATHATVCGLDLSTACDFDLATRMTKVCAGEVRPQRCRVTRPPRCTRARKELGRILAPLSLLDPGIAHTEGWRNPRPSRRAAESLCLAAVAEVREPAAAHHGNRRADERRS